MKTHPINEGLLMIHKIISRGLKQAIEKCREYQSHETLTSVELQGLSQYLSAFRNIVHAHHLGEDEVVFPYFHSRLEAPYFQLADEHQQISVLLDELDEKIPQLSSGTIGSIARILEKMNSLWAPHCKTEEEWFSAERLESLPEKPDEEKLAEEISQHGLKNSGPGYLALPFVLYTLDSEERKVVELPWMVRKVLLPVVWKRKWKAMQGLLNYYGKN